MFGVEHAQQLFFLDDKKGSRCNRCSCSHPDRLARHASLAKKVIRAKHRDDRFLSKPIHHGQFHAALLDVHYAVRSVALRVDWFAPAKFRNFSRHPCSTEKVLGAERVGVPIFLEFSWFHIQMETPALYGRSTASLSLPKGFPPELSKRVQSTVFMALR